MPLIKGKKNKKITDVISSVAPTIAAALGGPLAGTAVQALSTALFGKPDAPATEVEAAVAAASPETLLKMKQAENQFKLDLEKLGVDRDRLIFDDMNSARQRHQQVKDKEPAILAYLAMFVFALLVAIVLTQADMFAGNEFAKYVIGIVIGSSIGWVDKAYNFYLGSSKGSKEKADAIGRMMDKIE